MNYRFRVSNKRNSHGEISPLPAPNKQSRPHRRFRLRGADTLRRRGAVRSEPIEFTTLFEFGMLPEADLAAEHVEKKQKQKKKKRAKEKRQTFSVLRKAFSDIRADLLRLGRGLSSLVKKLKEKLRPSPKPKRINSLPVFAGALTAALLVSALSAGGVLLGLFSTYGRSYASVTIPDFLGKTPEEVLPEDNDLFNLIIQHEYNPDVPEGRVITQSPRAGVNRRIYDKDGTCTVVLTVSQGKEQILLEDLRGMSRRDAILSLRNQALSPVLTEQYSDTAPAGTVLETIPPEGTALSDGDTVTLRISLGKRIVHVSVPDLMGRTEAEADSLLRAAGLVPKDVSYAASSAPVGTIIAQGIPAYSAVESGSAVSYTVSAGDRYTVKTVPDLYGMSLSEATEALREYGLVVGNTYPVAGAAPTGTVIAQSPLPSSPITSATYSVDLYVIS